MSSHIRGRFNKPADKLAAAYTASLPYDRRLYGQDIAGSMAHASMLVSQGIITRDEGKAIVDALAEIRDEIADGKFQFKEELEDIHMAIEARLIEKIGDVGGKLHTARSRNDQVALDMRLYVKEAIVNTVGGIKGLQRVLLDRAEAGMDIVIPGYTHLQIAQPVLLAHHLLAYFEMLQRDVERFAQAFGRADVMPLGSGALAGVTFKVDREYIARELGFKQITRNSLDAVADRDFVLEYQAAASICMMHLSRLAEEIILWSSAEFGFVELDDAYATGSSIMPQKKNPDIAELARGKTGRVYGSLMALLTTLKALPLAYNRDLQEDKEGLFDTVDTLLPTLEVFAGMVKTMTFKADRAARALERGYVLATDLADYLVNKGEPFRNAHEIVAGLVAAAAAAGKTLEEMTVAEYQKHSPLFENDVKEITVASSLAARDIPGGTAPAQVKEMLAGCRKLLN